MSVNREMQVSTDSEREILVKREFDAPRQMVFDAHTKPELVKRWLLGPDGWSLPVCEIDLRAGGKFRYKWVQDSDGAELKMSGTFLEVTPPERTVHTEQFDEEWSTGASEVTTVFTERNGTTLMTMTIKFDSREARDAGVASGMAEGMAASYNRLDPVLASLTAK